MKRTGAVLLLAAGVPLMLLGLLFLVGAGGQVRRYAIGAACTALGAVFAGLGLRAWRRAESESPERLRSEVLELAKRRNGEISEADLLAGLGEKAEKAAPVLRALEEEGQCRRERREGQVHLVFPGLLPRVHVRRCEYCAAELPLAEEVAKCPRCGGSVKTGVERRSLGGADAYRMDE
ncbi:MAG: hypothetical protein HYZ28_22775 [Myxococcales bacterium]|nr:hypothetical protein [Myxococcales bacterium]